LLGIEYGQGPHSIIFPGKLHFIEEEGIMKLTETLDSPSDNTAYLDNIATRMIKKYVPMIHDEINQIRSRETSSLDYNKKIVEILDNAEYYVDDAINFMDQGKNELAVLSIGYADGLVDCLKLVSLGKKSDKSNLSLNF